METTIQTALRGGFLLENGMSRNGLGAMSVVNTFSPGDSITSGTTNGNNNDFADELTNSLALDGQSTMTGQLKLANGTVSAPGVTWGSDPDSGFYRIGSNNVGLALAGSKVVDFGASAVAITPTAKFGSVGNQIRLQKISGTDSADDLGILQSGSVASFVDWATGLKGITINTSSGLITALKSFNVTDYAGFGVAASSTFRGNFKGPGATNATYSLYCQNSAGTLSCYARDDGRFAVPETYNNTTATAANVFMDSNGILARSTSSLKYKKDVADYDKGLEFLRKLRPVYYHSKNPDDKALHAGLIAEEMHEAGLTEFVGYAKDGSPDDIQYPNMSALWAKCFQEVDQKNIELMAEVASLKEEMAAIKAMIG